MYNLYCMYTFLILRINKPVPTEHCLRHEESLHGRLRRVHLFHVASDIKEVCTGSPMESIPVPPKCCLRFNVILRKVYLFLLNVASDIMLSSEKCTCSS